MMEVFGRGDAAFPFNLNHLGPSKQVNDAQGNFKCDTYGIYHGVVVIFDIDDWVG